MEHVDCFKVLSNETRLRILEWLKEPKEHFPPQEGGDADEIGVCVGDIQRKTGCSQSTISKYLSMLKDQDFLTSRRIGKWTYYKRNEERIEELADFVRCEL